MHSSLRFEHPTRQRTLRCVLTAFSVGLLIFTGCQPKASVMQPPVAVDLERLLSRLADVSALAEPPLGRSYLVSSYDRDGGNQDWAVWTNTTPDGRITLLDVEGAGFLSRIWTASENVKDWEFFVDDESTPRLTLSSSELFSGEVFPFLAPLAGTTGGGRYSYLPVPFRRRLRVTVTPLELDPGARNYFQINYTRVAAPHHVSQSWPAALSQEQTNALQQVVKAWKARKQELEDAADRCLSDVTSRVLRPGDSYAFVDESCAGVVSDWAVQLSSLQKEETLPADVLRSLRLQMWWDGARRPSVDVPLGDFFCNAFYARRYAALPMGRLADGYVSRLPMPFRTRARCSIRNDSAEPVRLKAGARIAPSAPCGRLFHATWNAAATPGAPMTILKAKGTGHYSGCSLCVVGQDNVWTVLEGDEAILPDSGFQPPQLGTGTEDYFNGAYYYSGLFDHPLHGLVEKGAMRTDQYRFHALDAVPFDRTIDATIEFGYRNRSTGYFASVAYWYAETPYDSSISRKAAKLLKLPADRFEQSGFMAMLFELERAGLLTECAERCGALASRSQSPQVADLLSLRAAAYREELAGFSSVRTSYEEMAARPDSPAAAQAQDLIWFHESDRHALLGVHATGDHQLSLDGRLVSSGSGRPAFTVVRVKLTPGAHQWKMQFSPTQQGSAFALTMRTHRGQITSAGEWRVIEGAVSESGGELHRLQATSRLTNMHDWKFAPNAYIQMQSDANALVLWPHSADTPVARRLVVAQDWVSP